MARTRPERSRRGLARVSACCTSGVEFTGTVTVPRTSNQSAKGRTAGNAFPRGARLLSHADFERVYKLGRRHFSASLTAFYMARQEQSATAESCAKPGMRIGFTVGRALGGAVERNRIKRRMREAVRLSRPPFGIAADVVMNPKRSLLTADFGALLNEVRKAFVVIEEKLERKPDRSAVAPEVRDSSRRKPEA